jgi:hypothetical protein
MKDLRLTVPLFLLTVSQFLLQHTELLWVWMSIAIWEACTGTSTPAETKWGLYGGAFIGASFWNWRRAALRAPVAEEALAAEKKKSTPVRIFVEDSEALIDRYGHTGTLAEKLLAPHLDKWIAARGRSRRGSATQPKPPAPPSRINSLRRRWGRHSAAMSLGFLARIMQSGAKACFGRQLRHLGAGSWGFAMANSSNRPINSAQSRALHNSCKKTERHWAFSLPGLLPRADKGLWRF